MAEPFGKSVKERQQSVSAAQSKPDVCGCKEFCPWSQPRRRSALALARVEVLAQAVAEEVEGEDGERDGEPRGEHRVRRAAEGGEVARLFEHHAPGGRGRRHAEA